MFRRSERCPGMRQWIVMGTGAVAACSPALSVPITTPGEAAVAVLQRLPEHVDGLEEGQVLARAYRVCVAGGRVQRISPLVSEAQYQPLDNALHQALHGWRWRGAGGEGCRDEVLQLPLRRASEFGADADVPGAPMAREVVTPQLRPQVTSLLRTTRRPPNLPDGVLAEGRYQVCLNQRGYVERVRTLRDLHVPGADEPMRTALAAWSWRIPLPRPLPVCFDEVVRIDERLVGRAFLVHVVPRLSQPLPGQGRNPQVQARLCIREDGRVAAVEELRTAQGEAVPDWAAAQIRAQLLARWRYLPSLPRVSGREECEPVTEQFVVQTPAA